MRRLAHQAGWLDLLAGLAYHWDGPAGFEATLRALLVDERTTQERVVVLFGGLSGWAVRPLSDEVAALAYRRFPRLLRGDLRRWLAWSALHQPSQFLAALLEAQDEDLLDHLASQALWSTDVSQAIEPLARHYEIALAKDPAAFGQRAARVLAGASTTGGWRDGGRLAPGNRLARFLLEQATRLDLPATILRGMLEGPGPAAQLLALRALGADSEPARVAATEHLAWLLPLLLVPLPRPVWHALLRALFNAATTEDHARRIHGRARDALDLPQQGPYREPLIGLVGRLLARWPALRQGRERPIVFGGREA
jgi:hypothetical protein